MRVPRGEGFHPGVECLHAPLCSTFLLGCGLTEDATNPLPTIEIPPSYHHQIHPKWQASGRPLAGVLIPDSNRRWRHHFALLNSRDYPSGGTPNEWPIAHCQLLVHCFRALPNLHVPTVHLTYYPPARWLPRHVICFRFGRQSSKPASPVPSRLSAHNQPDGWLTGAMLLLPSRPRVT